MSQAQLLLSIFAIAGLIALGSSVLPPNPQNFHTFTFSDTDFMLDG